MITLVMPTKNRPGFVSQNLAVLNATGFKAQVALADSSDQKQFEETKRKIAGIGFEVIHKHTPGLGIWEAVASVLPEIETPFVAFMPDDDIVIPSTLMQCCRFLSRQPEYSACTGQAVIVSDLGVARYRLRRFDGATPFVRLSALLTDYCVVHYAVSHTQAFRRWWADGEGIADPYYGVELMLSIRHVLEGKVQQLPGLFVVRRDHPGRTSLRSPVKDPPDLFRQRLEAIAPGAPLELYLRRRTAPSLLQRAREKLFGVTLSRLMRPTHPYHQAFAPIYQAIVQTPR
jgi:glycosyltransferase domain-containing protein